MTAELSIAIAAGGTAGHVNPALALAECLRDRGHRVTFFGQPTRLEAKLVPQAGFPFVPVEVTGFDRARPWTALSSLARVARARRELGRRFAEAGAPDAAAGFGAYVEVPLLSWCAGAGVPYLLHEQNSVPGLANRMMAGRAARVCISVPAARAAFERDGGESGRVALTGNPVRRSVLAGDRARGRAALGIPADATVLLVFGGSLGARHLNERLAALKSPLLALEGLHVVHSTGAAGYDEAARELALTDAEARRWHVLPYIDDMGDVLAAADLVLARAGASSVAEIAALGAPSVLVPYPQATADHQTVNARYLTDAGAAELVADADIDGGGFAELLLALLRDPARRARMRDAARGLGQDRAADRLADAVEALARP